jgi:hypothetical protein
MLQVQRLALTINAANHLQLIRTIATALRIAWSFNQVLESFSPTPGVCGGKSCRHTARWKVGHSEQGSVGGGAAAFAASPMVESYGKVHVDAGCLH